MIKKGQHISSKIEWKKGCKSVGIPFGKGHIPFYKGKKNPTISGEKHWNYKGGLSPRYRIKMAPRPKPENCEVCGGKGKIVYDHDHNTGNFRGWLCENCNFALGHIKDRLYIAESLVKYIKRYEEKSK